MSHFSLNLTIFILTNLPVLLTRTLCWRPWTRTMPCYVYRQKSCVLSSTSHANFTDASKITLLFRSGSNGFSFIQQTIQTVKVSNKHLNTANAVSQQSTTQFSYKHVT